MIKKTTLVITPGDPEGIGPEVTAKALHALASHLKSVEVVLFGSSKPFQRYKKLIARAKPIFFEPPSRSSPGYQSGWSIETAAQFILAAPKDRILVTGPISKERLQKSGFAYHGHTDFLAKLTHTPRVTMVLANDLFRVALATDHCALHEVSKNLTINRLTTTFLHAYLFAKETLHKKKPRIAVLGLNPHAGENGLLGTEEQSILIPAMKAFSKKYKDVTLTGPHSADSFFAIEARGSEKTRHDVMIAMYHDQGLIPVKLSDFSNSLNLTLGLPFMRTSVDHGTAFNIAGKNKADASSMIYAIQKALEYRSNR